MTRTCATMTLVAGLGSLSCSGDDLCPQDDPPSLLITARSALDGTPLTGLSGTVMSGGYVLPIGCTVVNNADECNMHARGESADIHLEREGFAPWDTVNVRLMWAGREGCFRPILKRVEAEMVPE